MKAVRRLRKISRGVRALQHVVRGIWLCDKARLTALRRLWKSLEQQHAARLAKDAVYTKAPRVFVSTLYFLSRALFHTTFETPNSARLFPLRGSFEFLPKLSQDKARRRRAGGRAVRSSKDKDEDPNGWVAAGKREFERRHRKLHALSEHLVELGVIDHVRGVAEVDAVTATAPLTHRDRILRAYLRDAKRAHAERIAAEAEHLKQESAAQQGCFCLSDARSLMHDSDASRLLEERLRDDRRGGRNRPPRKRLALFAPEIARRTVLEKMRAAILERAILAKWARHFERCRKRLSFTIWRAAAAAIKAHLRRRRNNTKDAQTRRALQGFVTAGARHSSARVAAAQPGYQHQTRPGPPALKEIVAHVITQAKRT